MGNVTRKPGEDYRDLTESVLSRCRLLTGFSEDEIRAEHTRFFFVAEDGRLKKSKMADLINRHLQSSPHKHPRYLTDCIFSAIDTNDDGYIDFFEYLMSVKFFRTDSPIEKADFMFRIIDKNGDNKVSKKELEQMLKCLRKFQNSLNDGAAQQKKNEDPAATANAIFEQLDLDKSGYIGVSEFKDGWLKNEKVRVLFEF